MIPGEVLQEVHAGDTVVLPYRMPLSMNDYLKMVEQLAPVKDLYGIRVLILDQTEIRVPLILRAFGSDGDDAGTPIYDDMVASQ